MTARKVDVIVEARMRSTRLPGKVMLPAAGKPLLQLMLERLRRIPGVTDIIIATSMDPSNQVILDLAESMDIPVFRGDENDVLKRVLDTAQAFGTDVIVEITGDNPVIDPDVSHQVIQAFLSRGDTVDYVSNDVGHHRLDWQLTFPVGFSTKVFSTAKLAEVAGQTHHPVDREHVVNFLVKQAPRERIHNVVAEGLYRRPEIRLTLDTPEDYRVIKTVFEALYPGNPGFTARDIIEFLDSKPEVRDWNRHVVQQRYDYHA